MKEPYMVIGGQTIPFSQCPLWALRQVASGAADHRFKPVEGSSDLPFEKMYAAFLAWERTA